MADITVTVAAHNLVDKIDNNWNVEIHFDYANILWYNEFFQGCSYSSIIMRFCRWINLHIQPYFFGKCDALFVHGAKGNKSRKFNILFIYV